MRTFEVYCHPEKGWQAVKRGFSWPGFFLTIFWAFAKGLASHALVGLAVALALYGARRWGLIQGPYVHGLVLALAFGFMGNRWRSRMLLEAGWSLASTLPAESPRHASDQAAAFESPP